VFHPAGWLRGWSQSGKMKGKQDQNGIYQPENFQQLDGPQSPKQ
jgi:hypothetical protein